MQLPTRTAAIISPVSVVSPSGHIISTSAHFTSATDQIISSTTPFVSSSGHVVSPNTPIVSPTTPVFTPSGHIISTTTNFFSPVPPVVSPTLPKMSTWIESFLIDQVISTTFLGGTAGYGCIFEIRAKKDLVFRSLDLHVVKGTIVDVEVWSKADSYVGFEADEKSWKKIAQVTVQGRGQGLTTQIKQEYFEAIPVPSGSRQSFYVTLTTNELVYTKETTLFRGNVSDSDGSIEIFVGSGVGWYKFVNETYSPRLFNGVIHYSVLHSPSPTLSPTSKSPANSSTTFSPTRFVEWGENQKSLPVGFDGNMRGYGAIFTINSIKLDVKIKTLEFKCAANGTVQVQVYSRPGNFNRDEMATKDKWTVVSDTNVSSAGIGKGTAIPEEKFQPFRVARGRNYTIYITLTSKDLLYTDASTGNAGGVVYASDNFLKFYIGQGVNEPFLSAIYNARVFNGVIHYISEVNSKTAVPTPIPISPWIDSFQIDQVLSTSFIGGTGGYGCMFEIRMKSDVVLRSLDLHIAYAVPVDVEVWSKADSYVGFEADEKAWRKIAEVTVQGRGQGQATQIEASNFEAIAFASGSMQSLYVTLKTAELVYTKETGLFRGDVFASNDAIEICVGSGVAGSGIGGYTFVNEAYSPRLFNGVIHYSVLTTPSPTSAPTSPPFPPPEITRKGVVYTQQLIQISGVPDDHNVDAIGHFQRAAADFLSEAIRSTGVKIKIVIVNSDMKVDDVQEQRWLQISLNQADLATNSSEGSTKPQRSLGFYTTIAGEYRPPPYTDFTSLVENSFSDKGEVSNETFINDLKKADNHFANASSVKTEPVKFPLPPEVLALLNKGGLDQMTLHIIYGSCGFVVLIAVLLIFGMWCENRRRWRKVGASELRNSRKWHKARTKSKVRMKEEAFDDESSYQEPEFLYSSPGVVYSNTFNGNMASMNSFAIQKEQSHYSKRSYNPSQ